MSGQMGYMRWEISIVRVYGVEHAPGIRITDPSRAAAQLYDSHEAGTTHRSDGLVATGL